MRLADPASSRAVLVGTANPGQSDLPDLPGVAHSLSGLAGALCDRRFATLTPSGVSVLLNPVRPHATGVAIASTADEASDLVLVYLAGNLWLDPPSQPHLALARDENGSRLSSLELMWIVNTLAEGQARAKLLVLDVHLVGAGSATPTVALDLAQRCTANGRITSWVFATDDRRQYNQPGAAATAFCGTLLDIVHARRHLNYGFTARDLHDAACAQLRAQCRPDAVLIPEPTAHTAAEIVLFYQTAADPDPRDLAGLRQLVDAAGAAERQYHRPDLVADAYRSVVVAATRIVGPDHPVSLHARSRLAHWTGHGGQFGDAAYLYQRLWDDQRRLLAAGHPELARTETALAYWSQRR
jgi:hypothetical protein